MAELGNMKIIIGGKEVEESMEEWEDLYFILDDLFGECDCEPSWNPYYPCPPYERIDIPGYPYPVITCETSSNCFDFKLDY